MSRRRRARQRARQLAEQPKQEYLCLRCRKYMLTEFRPLGERPDQCVCVYPIPSVDGRYPYRGLFPGGGQ